MTDVTPNSGATSNLSPLSSSDPVLRDWQQRALRRIAEHQDGAFLLEACPGAGKTLPALSLVKQQLDERWISRVLVLCPTTHLARQWARAAAAVEVHIEPNWHGPVLPADTHGLAITYQRMAAMPELYRALCRQPLLVIADEPHHMGTTAAWGQAFALACEPAAFRLLLSGTPFRSDNDPIPGVTYDGEGVATPDFAFTYSDAIRDGICRRIAFVEFDGELRWAADGAVVKASFRDDLEERQGRMRHRTAVSTAVGSGITQMVRQADARLSAVRKQGHRNAGGLVVASDIQHAREIAALISRELRTTATVVASDDPAAGQEIERFAGSNERWLVAVNMVSEGVDIPRLRVGVYATTIRTPLFFRQVIGRFVRKGPTSPDGPSYLYLPADPELRALARQIEQEMRHTIVADPDPNDNAREGAGDRSPGSFVPLSASFERSATVMGGSTFEDAEQAAAVETIARSLGMDQPEVLRRLGLQQRGTRAPVPSPPAFERRETLRRERKRLVGRIHHALGRDYDEIQRWVNKQVASGRPVNQHTLDELEAAVKLLSRVLAEPSREMVA